MSPRRIKREIYSRERSASPRIVKKEIFSHERSSSPPKSKPRSRRSRSPDTRFPKESPHRSVKTERDPTTGSSAFSENRDIRDSHQGVTSTQEPSHRDIKPSGNLADPFAAPAVDLSKVKIEPTEYSLESFEQLQTYSASRGGGLKAEPNVTFELPIDASVRNAGALLEAPPAVAEPSASLPDPHQASMDVKYESAEDFVGNLADISQASLFPDMCRDVESPPSSSKTPAEAKEVPAAPSNVNSSHTEGYSSGMESEESFSDVERAVPGVPVGVDSVVKKELKKYVKYFVPRDKFKDAVIKEVGPYLKKFYKKHQISKEDYKEIFKKVIKKVCTSSSEKKRLVCTKAIHRLCHTYVKRARIQIKLDCKFGEGS